MNDALLVVNAGSSSIKFALFPAARQSPAAAYYRGLVESKSEATHFRVTDRDRCALADEDLDARFSHRAALDHLQAWIEARAGDYRILAAGHRVVHGGEEFAGPVRITPEVIASLDALIPLARTHEPHEVAAIKALVASRPQLPQVACFDTAFHATQPSVARALALPRDITDAGIRRYGFHGLSYEYIAGALPAHLGTQADGRVVVAHLGAGASMCALAGRASVATTMGFSTLDGLVMGTRSGSLDPGVLLYLIEERGMTAQQVSDLLYLRSGLLGVSGVSADMRTLLAADDANARAAIALFVYRATRELGSLAAAVGGLDALVFTGGIGEHAAPIRDAICTGARWLGVELDPAANATNHACISTASSRVKVLVIPTDEEIIIARHTSRLLGIAAA